MPNQCPIHQCPIHSVRSRRPALGHRSLDIPWSLAIAALDICPRKGSGGCGYWAGMGKGGAHAVAGEVDLGGQVRLGDEGGHGGGANEGELADDDPSSATRPTRAFDCNPPESSCATRISARPDAPQRREGHRDGLFGNLCALPASAVHRPLPFGCGFAALCLCGEVSDRRILVHWALVIRPHPLPCRFCRVVDRTRRFLPG